MSLSLIKYLPFIYFFEKINKNHTMQKLYFLILCLLFVNAQTYSQKKILYQQYLKKELKTYKVFSKQLHVDLNCDKIKDYALVLQNRKDYKEINLYVIYSFKDTFIVQNLGDLADPKELSVEVCEPGMQCFGRKNWKCNSVMVSCIDYNYLFEFDSKSHTFQKTFSEHIGP